MPDAIRSFFIPGPAGRLEALLNSGDEGPSRAALVCHPHPLFGGTMHNKVVYHAMKALNAFRYPVLRFNFRGTGMSEGKHDRGRGEEDDVRAAIAWLRQEFHLPMIFAGFSFGAATGIRAACREHDIIAIIALGLPVDADDRHYQYDFLQECTKPKLFVSGDHDQFAPAEELQKIVARVPEPKKFVLIDNADHFFEGRLPQMRGAIEQWVRELPDGAPEKTSS
jgi:alpha/beta superfamily hydrolase